MGHFDQTHLCTIRQTFVAASMSERMDAHSLTLAATSQPKPSVEFRLKAALAWPV